MMGSSIEVHSEEGKGSEFFFVLNLEESLGDKVTENSLEGAENENPIPDFSGKKVLIVEDNMFNQKLIETLLEKYKFTCHVVSNGKEALKKIEEDDFDICLMDMHMPVLGGIETTEQLRENGCKMPVIALTAAATKEDMKKCFDAGMNDYIAKPIDEDEMIEKMMKCLEDGA